MIREAAFVLGCSRRTTVSRNSLLGKSVAHRSERAKVSLSAPQPGIQHVAECVAQQVDAEDRQGEGYTRGDG